MSITKPTTEETRRRALPRQTGVTLGELMITIAIVGILAAIAYPTFQDQMRKTRRSEAVLALVEMANLEELYYGDNFSYTTTNSVLPYPTTTDNGNYALTIPSATTAPAFTVRATIVAGQAQAGDTECATFELTSTNIKSSKDADGNTSTGCWRE